jgi:uncharacterized protein (UPF0276 family)
MFKWIKRIMTKQVRVKNDNLTLGIGIEFNEESIKQLKDVLKIVEKLNEQIEKLNSNEKLGNVNNITINASTFVKDEKDIREFAESISQHINEQINKS